MSKHFFETTAGIKISIQPISMLDLQLAQDAVENEFRERGEPIDPPTYEVEVLGGEKEHHQHTAETIKDASDEEKEAWKKHFQAMEEMQKEIQDRTAFVFLEGVVFELPTDDAWIKRRKRLFGETVPEDEDERKLYYLNNVLLKTPADKSGITLKIQRISLTGANEEAIQAMETLFRHQMGIQERDALEQIKTLVQETESGLVVQPNATGRAGGQGVGADT